MSLIETSGHAAAFTSRYFWFYLFLSLRPKQWVKNTFVYAAILFSGNLLNMPLLLQATQTFIIFCLLSSGNYLINDLVDRQRDRCHPRKRQRPIAAGKLPPMVAMIAALIILTIGLCWAFILSHQIGLIALLYTFQTVAYTYYLKHMVIIDAFTIALGFVLRVAAGAAAIMVPASAWLLITVILLSLFLTLCKRRHELIILKDAASHRTILAQYSVELLDQLIATVASATIVVYAVYTFQGTKIPTLMFSVPLVLFGICRYMYLIYRHQDGGEPESLIFRDKPLAVTILLWSVCCLALLYW